MVSLEDSHSHSHSHHSISSISHSSQTRPYYYTPPPSSAKINRSMGRSMRTIRSTIFGTTDSISEHSGTISENLTDSVIDIRLNELAKINPQTSSPEEEEEEEDISTFLELSQAFSDFSSACSSDISGELHRLANVPDPGLTRPELGPPEPEPEPCYGFLERDKFSTEIIESISPEDLQPTVKLCVDSLLSPSLAVKRSATAKLRLLAKNRADNRALIGESGAINALIPLLRCTDPWTQEHAVTGLLNLSLHEPNKALITSDNGAIKSLIYVLKTGTDTSKQNAACALLSLALVDDQNKLSIGACGAIPPLVCLLINGTNRGKKDALTTLYKLCSVKLNKERAISAGAVKPLVGLVGEQGNGLAEKAMVVLSILCGIDLGKEAIVEEGGIAALVEAIEDSSDKGKEFAVLTLLQLCVDSVRNRGLLVREGGIPPLVALSQNGTAKAKHKAETLLGYLREPRQEASSSTP
ncbi:U-box domain-containing protein 4 [Lycium barbarum]|uniref:U-box domain-containing protein 4 n=1 Tax=Lycium barbarum TaxID=112863 RepID=UPI00293EEB4F|nr:U-box domain-containing protein 4 [Lycium barbarum]